MESSRLSSSMEQDSPFDSLMALSKGLSCPPLRMERLAKSGRLAEMASKGLLVAQAETAVKAAQVEMVVMARQAAILRLL